MFSRLRTRLTVLYAGLFGAAMILVSVALVAAINAAAQRQVRDELTASGTVFDRVWSLRADRLREGALLLSRDFGVREAAATGEAATIASAMENLRRRFGVEQAFVLRTDGSLVGPGADRLAGDAARLQAAFNGSDDPAGVMLLHGQPYQLTSAPILSPDLIGWAVFAVRLDRSEMAALERLSAIPLQAAVMHRSAGGWRSAEPADAEDARALSRFIAQAAARPAAEPELLNLAAGPAVVLAKPLPAVSGGEPAVLLLRYPLAEALAPYRPLLVLVAAAGLLGLAIVGWGSWMLARGVTRPISALDEAVRRLQRGEEAQAPVKTSDEIGRLARSFNAMAVEIRERERRITHLALHDQDTGLPNRLSLERVVERLSDLPAERAYVAALGLQRFDHVRGAIGYALAAEAVRMIGARLQRLAPAAGASRIATDVLGFAIVADGPQAAADDAARLMAELERPLMVGGETIDVALTLGLAPLAGGAGASIERASIALDQARAARGKVAFFDAAAYGDPASNLSLMSDMLMALDAGEIELWHQPKFDLRRRQVTGVEGLVRWRHPTRGLLPPDVFIPMAEETGHIRTLTEWVVRQAIDDQQALAASGHLLDVAVNLSGRTLGEADFADFALAEARRAVGGLSFEITETAVIESPEIALAQIGRFAEGGVQVAIDDFGAGLSSLAYLKQIRAQELKIDKSIVEGVTESQRDALIVRSAIDLAHSLGLKVTAEGVETEAGLTLLAGMGCDQVQGYVIAKALPVADLVRFLDEARGGRRSYG